MQLLHGSHVFLWFDDPQQLTPMNRAVLDDGSNELHLSTASIWELTLKRSLGKLHFTGAFAAAAARYGIHLLLIGVEHIIETEGLPRIHKDPFDQIMIAQAMVEGLVLVTHDEVMTRYPVASMRV